MTAQERSSLERDLRELEAHASDPDVQIFSKGVAWALRYEDRLTPKDEALIKKGLDRGLARAAEMAAGRSPWAAKKGRVVRGYRSAIDDSIQPYGVIVPAGYDPARAIRLDVVLHGSQQPRGLSELLFMDRFDGENVPAGPGPDQDFIELHPLARVENGYRWAGETDVFEAIEAACRAYTIDRSRIVLRGMSAGASGTWHVGLTHPDRFAALGPYCGYVDTHRFSETPVKSFIRVGPLPEYQERTLSMLDAVDYAANARMVPVVAAIGDKDVFFECHQIMSRAMEREGLHLLNLISPGTGHVIDPPVFKEQLRRISECVAAVSDRAPRHVHFVTWTLKYSRCHWLEALSLREHYVRAELEGEIGEDGILRMQDPKNIDRFAILPPASAARRIQVGSQEVSLPRAGGERPIILEWSEGKWIQGNASPIGGKRPGLQGPIDDAFTAPFLCVRGTSPAWNADVQACADAALHRFSEEWRFYFRAELPIKDDGQVTKEDLARRHLVLFGDPGSNRWIGQALSGLPLTWTRQHLQIRGKSYSAADHVPVLVCPNPIPGAEGRYLVLNSGHTFHKEELKLNYLTFPRLGDWAVLAIAGPSGETTIEAGLFDERWR